MLRSVYRDALERHRVVLSCIDTPTRSQCSWCQRAVHPNNTCRTTSRRRSRSWTSRVRRLRARSGRKRLRRAVHPHTQGELALGHDLRNDRRTPAALLAFRETYNTKWLIERQSLYEAVSVPTETASTRRQGGVGFNLASQKPRAVQLVGGIRSACLPIALRSGDARPR